MIPSLPETLRLGDISMATVAQPVIDCQTLIAELYGDVPSPAPQSLTRGGFWKK